MPLSKDKLAAIRQRLQEATPGPWRENDNGRIEDAEGREIASVIVVNREFIAHSRQDVSDLLDDLTYYRRMIFGR